VSHDESTAARLARSLWNRAIKLGIALPITPNTRLIENRGDLAFYPVLGGDHPTKWCFPDSFDNPNCAWLQAIKSLYAEPISFPSSLSPDAGLLLHSLIRNLRPRIIVEVGVFISVSTHWMAAALLDAGIDPAGPVIHCFDDFGPIHKMPYCESEMLEGRLEWVTQRLESAGLIDYVEFHVGDSSPNLAGARERLIAAGGVDFAFIDGDHSIRGATKDFVSLEPALNTGGYVLLHDTFPEQCGMHKGPRYVCDNINKIGSGTYELCEIYLAPLNYGMALLRRIG